MKKIILVASFVMLMIITHAQTSDAIQKYIDTYKALAINEEIRTGVPAAITLAQGIIETQAGLSDLCIASNNHFGIKCKENWTGATVFHDDDARGECFRSYPKAEDSYRDHSDFLKTRPNYSFLFKMDPADYEGWAYGLKKAGYATNPVYAKMLIKTIEENNLEQYTLIALEQGKNEYKEDVAVNDNKAIVNTAFTNGPAANANIISEEKSAQEEALKEYDGGASYPSGMFTINHTKVIYAAAGTSLFALASNSNIDFQKLAEYNDLGNTDILGKDQLIYLEKKPKKSDKDYHVVAPDETIEDIARKEGVQLQSLFEYNKMQKGLQPVTGEKVYLHPGKPPYYPRLIAKSYANR